MADQLMIIVAAVFAAGIAVGVIAVISTGIRREERRFRDQQDLFLAGQLADVHLPEDAPDRLSGGARRVTGLYVRRDPTASFLSADQELRV